MSQITEPVAQLLKGKNFAYLSTLMKDGSPQVTPTWVDIDKDGNSILINTAEGRIKHKNLSRDPRVAISVSLGMDKYPYRSPNEKRVILKIKPEKVFHQQPPK